MKRAAVVLGVVLFGVLGLTVLDSQDERRCRREALTELVQRKPTASEVTIVNITSRQAHGCDGFLPW
jgi:hypothetical protein